MRANDDGKTVAAMDVLVPKIGEIIGGSQREERLDRPGEKNRRIRLKAGGLLVVSRTARIGLFPMRALALALSDSSYLSPAWKTSATSSPFPAFPATPSFRLINARLLVDAFPNIAFG